MLVLTTQELRGRVVVSLGQDAQIGLVQDVLVDPATNRVRGVQVRNPRTRTLALLRIEDILRIRPDSVIIADRLFLQDSASAPLETLPRGSDLGHIKVVSYAGTVLGMLRDVEFDPSGFHITRYLMGSSLWRGRPAGARSFPPAPGLRVGADVLVVPDAIVATLQATAPPSVRAPAYSDSEESISGSSPAW
jgi:uncharacterized protein YrrD